MQLPLYYRYQIIFQQLYCWKVSWNFRIMVFLVLLLESSVDDSVPELPCIFSFCPLCCWMCRIEVLTTQLLGDWGNLLGGLIDTFYWCMIKDSIWSATTSRNFPPFSNPFLLRDKSSSPSFQEGSRHLISVLVWASQAKQSIRLPLPQTVLKRPMLCRHVTVEELKIRSHDISLEWSLIVKQPNLHSHPRRRSTASKRN